MRKSLAYALMLSATLGLAACDKSPKTLSKMPTRQLSSPRSRWKRLRKK